MKENEEPAKHWHVHILCFPFMVDNMWLAFWSVCYKDFSATVGSSLKLFAAVNCWKKKKRSFDIATGLIESDDLRVLV